MVGAAELTEGAELGLSSTETGSWKAMVGVSDGLPEGAALIDGEDDETVGLVEGPATRVGLSEGLVDEITDTLGVLLGSPLGRAEALKDGEAFGAVEVVGAAELIEGMRIMSAG